MLVKRFTEAKPYEAPNHWGVVGLRLQGFEPGGPTNQWVEILAVSSRRRRGSHSTPFEKVYVVLSGRMTLIVDGEETVLSPMNSCTIAANEMRKIENRENDVCKMLVVIPYPPGVKP